MQPLLPVYEGAECPALRLPLERSLSSTSQRRFLWWTVFWWGLVGLWGILFYAGTIDFTFSAKISLYGVSVWMNGWMLALIGHKDEKRSRIGILHECLCFWMITYCMTNLLWEMPWVLTSRFVFNDLSTLDDVVAKTEYMRANPLHMWWWIVGSFGAVDLRTVNRNSTFFTLELNCFANLAESLVFFHLNRKRSPLRYLVPVLGAGAPVAFTIMFSFTEVFNGFANMPGNTADTLLALCWTQYQFVVFPIIFCYWGLEMLFEDWKHCYLPSDNQ
mmetsp:Transcript_20719/g.25120  ORF Transcript_20719/g.25120 Transcript_20719/m.25120 type:complete len:274 (+) Transcript_20719:1646-2467(+)